MTPHDITVEVRNVNLQRVGIILPSDLDIEVAPLHNAVGSWKLKLRADHPLCAELRKPGSGIVITSPAGTASGPTTDPESVVGLDDIAGSITFTGVTDTQLLFDRLAYPEPGNEDTTTQAEDYDVRSGPAETVIRGYVEANIGPLAPASRRAPKLAMSDDEGRGPVVEKSARFDNIGELTSTIANTSGLRQDVVQRGDSLVYEVSTVSDRSAEVRLDVRNGTAAGHRAVTSAPKATHVITGMAEENYDRLFNVVTTDESVAASEAWGRRVERFVDQRQTLDPEESSQGARDLLAADGVSQTSVQVTTNDDSSDMRFGIDWNLGDTIGVVVEGIEVKSVVTGYVLKSSSAGTLLGVTLGEATVKFSAAGTTAKQIAAVASRLSVLERNTFASQAKNAPINDPEIGDALQDIYDQAEQIAEAAQTAANIGTAAQQTADGKNTVTYSADPPGNTPNEPGDIWWQRATTPESPIVPVVVAQYEGQGGTTWAQIKLSSLAIAYIDAAVLTAGSAFVNGLRVLTNFTLGGPDANGNIVDGAIQTYNFGDPDEEKGVLISRALGIVAKGALMAAPEIIGGTITGTVFLTDGFYTSDLGVRIDEDGIYAKGGTFVGSNFSGSYSTDAGSNSRQGSFDWSGLTLYNSTYPVGALFLSSADGSVYARGAITSESGVSGSTLSGGEVYSTSQSGASAGDAEFGNEGRIRRKGSTIRIKRNVQPMTLEQANAGLDIDSVWYQRKDEVGDDGTVYVDDTVYPGFIAEQAHEAGATGWVIYDNEGLPSGIRYSEVTVAHNTIIRHLRDENAELRSRIEAIEAHLGLSA